METVDIITAQSTVDLRLANTEKTPYPFLINMKGVKTMKKEARNFFGSKRASERVTAAALLIDSMLGATIGNFFLRINKPPVPTRIFTDEEEAIKWLNKNK